MGIKSKLTTDGSIYSVLNGTTPTVVDLKSSTLHNSYSINGTPSIIGRPTPSILDLDGKTPEKYIDKIIE